jgi:Zn-dependent peptidase ImmA (M78 family)
MSKRNVEQAIRRHWHSAPVNIAAIIRASGIELDDQGNLDNEVSGELRRLDSGLYKITVNRKDHPYRKRFTMAHELAHYYLHASLVGEGTDDDRVYNSTSAGNFYNTDIEQKHEYEANSLAIYILMPEHTINAWVDQNSVDVPLSKSSTITLAEHLQVSLEALQIRLKAIGIAFQS